RGVPRRRLHRAGVRAHGDARPGRHGRAPAGPRIQPARLRDAPVAARVDGARDAADAAPRHGDHAHRRRGVHRRHRFPDDRVGPAGEGADGGPDLIGFAMTAPAASRRRWPLAPALGCALVALIAIPLSYTRRLPVLANDVACYVALVSPLV